MTASERLEKRVAIRREVCALSAETLYHRRTRWFWPRVTGPIMKLLCRPSAALRGPWYGEFAWWLDRRAMGLRE